MKKDKDFEEFRKSVGSGTSERLTLYLIDAIRRLDGASRLLTIVLIVLTAIQIWLGWDLIGRSNNLGRREAQRAINRAVKIVPQAKTLLIRTGLVSGYCYDIYTVNYNPTSSLDYKALVKLGMVTAKAVDNGWQVEFTEAGKRAVQMGPYAHTQKTNCDSWQSSLPVAIFDGIEVTGIQQEEIRAKADFALKWKLTPLGLAIKTLPEGDDEDMGLGNEFAQMPKGGGEFLQNDVATFDKYDDGWRLKTPE